MTLLRRSRSVVWLAAALIAVKSLVVVGWMPVVAEDGSLRMVICSGTGPAQGSAGGAHDHGAHDHGSHDHGAAHADHGSADAGNAPLSDAPPSDTHTDACAFAVMAAAVALSDGAPVLAEVAIVATPAYTGLTGRRNPPAQIAVVLPPAQGPPLFS